jgi:hypothetical protein
MMLLMSLLGSFSRHVAVVASGQSALPNIIYLLISDFSVVACLFTSLRRPREWAHGVIAEPVGGATASLQAATSLVALRALRAFASMFVLRVETELNRTDALIAIGDFGGVIASLPLQAPQSGEGHHLRVVSVVAGRR